MNEPTVVPPAVPEPARPPVEGGCAGCPQLVELRRGQFYCNRGKQNNELIRLHYIGNSTKRRPAWCPLTREVAQ